MIYLLQSGSRSGPVRIGHSEHVLDRVGALQAASPKPLRVVATIPGGRSDANALAAKFAEHSAGPSWFRPALPIFEHFASALVDAARHASTPDLPTETQAVNEPRRATVEDARRAIASLPARSRRAR